MLISTKMMLHLQDMKKIHLSSMPKYLVFGSGEAKGIINESVRGKDLYLMVDVCNYSLTYSLTGNINHMSPDDHYQGPETLLSLLVGGRSVVST